MHEVEAKSILTNSNGINIYRGCTHGCIYCDARSSCYQMNHPFEDIQVKTNAPDLLEQTLRKKRNQCMIGTGGMTDPFMPIEKDLELTRKCLEIIDCYGFGLAIQTKSDLILRDLDILKRIHKKTKCVVQITLTTFDDELCKIIEPNVCPTSKRIEVLKVLQEAQIPTVVWMTPILPFINDTVENIRNLMIACGDARVYGIVNFGLGLTLRDGDRQYYYKKLDEHFPGLKDKYISTYGNDYGINSPNQKLMYEVLLKACKHYSIKYNDKEIFKYLHTFEDKRQGEQISFL